MTKRKPIDPVELFFYFVIFVIILCFFIGLVTAALTDWLFGLSLLGAIVLIGWLLSLIGILQRDHLFVKATRGATEWCLEKIFNLIKKK